MSPRHLLGILLLVCAALAPAAGALFVPSGTPKTHCEEEWEWWEHRYVPPLRNAALLVQDGNLDDCDADGIGADFDGHFEFAAGGASLAAGPAALACVGEAPHHPAFPLVIVPDDAGLGPVTFTVGADRSLTTPVGADAPCGDRLTDERITCVSICRVPFAPGVDGTYLVTVEDGVGGRIWTRT